MQNLWNPISVISLLWLLNQKPIRYHCVPICHSKLPYIQTFNSTHVHRLFKTIRSFRIIMIEKIFPYLLVRVLCRNSGNKSTGINFFHSILNVYWRCISFFLFCISFAWCPIIQNFRNWFLLLILQILNERYFTRWKYPSLSEKCPCGSFLFCE